MFLFDLIKKIFTLSPVTIGEKVGSIVLFSLVILFCHAANPWILSTLIGNGSVALGFMFSVYILEILCMTFCGISGILIGYNCIKNGISPIEPESLNHAEINQSKIFNDDNSCTSSIMSEVTPEKYGENIVDNKQIHQI
ncbi:hypothetical protein CAXC1_260005 [Candidatus Xenohaliotis californiensis]|uniref:Uncharacterized protein n=1 Tax=Candidatus Xenohaliotis californiensis TaxID=84677 RepID=A0ABM9N802_9RICK|nr:hypothetical protein CAXC1_260005 [Candidatus Xenohaliotis californiensis]